MAQQTINVGTAPNDGTGTPLRTAFQYTNSNFSELYTAVGPSGNNIVVPGNATITGALTVDTSTLKVDATNHRVGIGTASPYSTAESLNARTTALTSIAAFQSIPLTVTDSTAYALGVGGGINFRAKLDPTNYSNYAAIWSYRESAINSDYRGSLIIGTSDNSNGYPIERYRIGSDGTSTWSVGGTTAMTLNSTGLGVKGTVGTSSGDAVIAFGTRGRIIGNTGSAISNGSFIDIAVTTAFDGYQGFLSVANTLDANANARTQTTFSVFGRGASSTITQIATANGPTSGASFTVTTPSAGVIRITNTAGFNSTIAVQFFGATSG